MKKFLANDLTKYKNIKGTKPILFVSDLYKKYPHKARAAINKISFNVYPGQFHVFIGSNGAGKTTTIKSIINAYVKWTGTILIDGKRNDDINAKVKVGYIPEVARFPSKMSAWKYLMWMGRLSCLSNDELTEATTTYLQKFNMWNLRNHSPNSFSSGQKQKVLLIQSLLHNPDILIMDEPVANLDPRSRVEFFNYLIDLTHQKKAIFISSHNLDEIDKYADSMTILDGGKIVFTGTRQNLYETYGKKTFVIQCSDNDKMGEFLKANDVDFTFDKKNNCFQLTKISEELKDKIIAYLAKEKISLIKFCDEYKDLNEIYLQLTKLGSVDTMQVKNGK